MPGSGSSLAALITADQIVLTADSALTLVTNGSNDFGTICKLRREGNRFYGAVGDYGVPGTDADVWAIARDTVCRAKTSGDVYGIAEPIISALLPGIVERNRTADPNTYDRWLSGVPVISLVFAWFENGKPLLVSVEFRIDAKGSPIHPQLTILGPPIPGNVNAAR